MEPRPWRVLSRRYILDRSPYMVLREDSVELPNGARIDDYFVFEYPDWVIVLAVTVAHEFVLVQQYRHGIAQVHLELAAGVADGDVPLLENAQRELLEETGFGGGDWQAWMSVSANPGTHTNTAHIFLATGVEKIKEQELEDTEDIAVSILNASQMLEALRTGQVFQSMHAAALWRYFAELGMPPAPV